MDHVSWSLGLFLKPLLEGRPNTKPGTMALQNLATVDLLYFIICEDPA